VDACCSCVRYVNGWTSDGCHVANNLLLGVDQHVDCTCHPAATIAAADAADAYAVLIETPRAPSTVGYTVWFHVTCFFCIVSYSCCGRYVAAAAANDDDNDDDDDDDDDDGDW